jgi:PAS domain S-box-containing protein
MSTVFLVILLTLLVGIVLAQHNRKKRVEAEVRKSEERFRLFMDNSPAIAWMKDEQGQYVYINQTYQKQLGVRLEDRIGKTDLKVYPHAIAQEFRKNDEAALAFGRPIEVTEDAVSLDGRPFKWLAYKFPFRDASGQVFVGGIGIDITERVIAREALQALTGRLIHAQEEERARIARELHDDFSQRLGLLCIGLGHLWKTLPKSDAEDRARVREMLKETKELSSDLHTLSHELHSSRLEHVGLVSALRGLCKEVSEKHKIEIHFAECDLRLNMPKEVGLCLFRAAQEALNNVVRHSQAKSAHVELSANTSCVSLHIRDDGRGFDSDRINPVAGIGLLGMHERIRLVGGRLLVRAELTQGTEILAEVPLSASTDEADTNVQAARK